MPKISRVGKFRRAASAAQVPAKVSPLSPSSKLSSTKPSSASISTSSEIGPSVVQSEKKQELRTDTEQQDDSSATIKRNLSRGQRKRAAKREQYLRKERMIMSSLTLKRKEDQKNRIDGLDAIREALLNTASAANAAKTMKSNSATAVVKTNKSRQLLVRKEVAQMNLVLQHPAFKADPFAAIQEHLKNTHAKDSDQQKKAAILRVRQRKQKEEEKKARKKEQGVKRHKKKFRATRSKTR